MKKKGVPWFTVLICIMFLAVLGMSTSASVFAQALPGGTLNPLSIPKYVTPLVIPPVMPKSVSSPAPHSGL